VCYAKEDGDAPNPVFQTLDEWLPVRSTKMDVCAKVCTHYLSADSVLDVEFVDGQAVFPPTGASSGLVTQERKILIYAEFPSMTPLLQNVSTHDRSKVLAQLTLDSIQVLKLYGIESLSINGAIPFKQRDMVVEQFVHKPDSPRVLIFSSIGSAGLNLPIADVVIFFVSHQFCCVVVHFHLLARFNQGSTLECARREADPWPSPPSATEEDGQGHPLAGERVVRPADEGDGPAKAGDVRSVHEQGAGTR
jgi:hypothetical protein